MNNTIRPTKRSIKLLQEEKRELKKFCKTFSTEVDCALAIGIDRNVLARVRQLGSGSEITISRIRETLGKCNNNTQSPQLQATH